MMDISFHTERRVEKSDPELSWGLLRLTLKVLFKTFVMFNMSIHYCNCVLYITENKGKHSISFDFSCSFSIVWAGL